MTPAEALQGLGVRTWTLCAYNFGSHLFAFRSDNKWFPSPVHVIRELGCYCLYTHENPRTGRKKKKPMDIEKMANAWRDLVVGLTLAHDKDDADRYEASVDDLLTPFLSAPVAQIRQFAPRLVEILKADKRVPYLVWRAYELYVETLLAAKDEAVIQLKSELAEEIARMVESDVQDQIVPAMVRALQWRDPEKLEQVKKVVEDEKAAGRKVRLRGRESCLFLEAGGTEESPAVCVQV